MIQPKENTLLIADPFLKDDNFIRSVIFLCNHNEEGSFGLVLNKLFDFTLNNLVSGVELFDIPVFVGGPVALDTIHFLHQYPDLIPDCQKLDEDLGWGGDFETIKSLINSGDIDIHKIKFFIGYSGWSAGQLEDEIKEKTWITSSATRNIIFDVPENNIWKKSIINLGGEYEQLANYPIDPQLN
jgi:putative transcriptional regulator